MSVHHTKCTKNDKLNHKNNANNFTDFDRIHSFCEIIKICTKLKRKQQ